MKRTNSFDGSNQLFFNKRIRRNIPIFNITRNDIISTTNILGRDTTPVNLLIYDTDAKIIIDMTQKQNLHIEEVSDKNSTSHKRQRLDLPLQIETQENVARLPSDSADEALSNERKKEIIREYNKKYYKNNKVKIKKQDQKKYKKNKEKIKEKDHEYYIKNKEKINKRNKEWQKENKENTKEKDHEYYIKNKEKINKRNKEWHKKDKEKKKIAEAEALRQNAAVKYKELQTKKSEDTDDSDHFKK